jgi:hypothetical protein
MRYTTAARISKPPIMNLERPIYYLQTMRTGEVTAFILHDHIRAG